MYGKIMNGKLKLGLVFFAALVIVVPSIVMAITAGSGMQTEYGPYGLQKVTYNGITVLDATAPTCFTKLGVTECDADNIRNRALFNILRLNITDASIKYNVDQGSMTRAFDATTKTLTVRNNQITATAQYLETVTNEESAIRIKTNVTNNSDRAFTAVELNVGGFKLPNGILGDQKGRTSELGPMVSSNHLDVARQNMMKVTNNDVVKRTVVLTFANGQLIILHRPSSNVARNDNPREPFLLLPGQSVESDITVHFVASPITEDHQVPSIATLYTQYGQVITNLFNQTNPAALFNWTNHKPIGVAFVANSGNRTASNRRGWTLEGAPVRTILTPAGLQDFHDRLMRYADTTIANLQRTGSQGVIVWDLEGEEASPYVGDPRLLSASLSPTGVSVAPEMDAVADEFFKKFTDKGFAVGVTVRPDDTRVYLETRPNNAAFGKRYVRHHAATNFEAALAQLSGKMDYAQSRWGATLFYIDSPNFGSPGMDRENSVRFGQICQAKGRLCILENTSRGPNIPLHHAVSAPFASAWHQTPGTRVEGRLAFPNASTFDYTADMENESARKQCYTATAIAFNDIPAFRSWYPQPYIDTIMAAANGIRSGIACTLAPGVNTVPAAWALDRSNPEPTPPPTPVLSPKSLPLNNPTQTPIPSTAQPLDAQTTLKVQQLQQQLQEVQRLLQSPPSALTPKIVPPPVTTPTPTPTPSTPPTKQSILLEEITNRIVALKQQVIQMLQDQSAAVSGGY